MKQTQYLEKVKALYVEHSLWLLTVNMFDRKSVSCVKLRIKICYNETSVIIDFFTLFPGGNTL